MHDRYFPESGEYDNPIPGCEPAESVSSVPQLGEYTWLDGQIFYMSPDQWRRYLERGRERS